MAMNIILGMLQFNFVNFKYLIFIDQKYLGVVQFDFKIQPMNTWACPIQLSISNHKHLGMSHGEANPGAPARVRAILLKMLSGSAKESVSRP